MLPELTDLVAEVRLGGRSLGRLVAMPGFFPVKSYPARSNHAQIPMTCDLDRARIEGIERQRAAHDLTLDLNFFGRFNDRDGFSGSEQYNLNRGVWVDVLAQMEYQKTLLIEVPMPDPAAQPELAEAVGFLAQAQKHMLNNHDRDAVGTLRDALDQLALALGDDDGLDPAGQALFANQKAMTKADRLRVLRRALKLVTHPARHRDEVTVGIDWSRIDSAQMIAMTAAFMNEMAAPGARPSRAAAGTDDDD